jgi:diketogulonate reductase-like aldo/keto reductase
MAALNMSLMWLSLGGRRFDGADSYGIEPGIGEAIKMSGVPRKEVFIVSKTGPGGLAWPLGYNETKQQVQEIVANYSTTYVDLMLVHWPVNYGPCADKGPPRGRSIPTTDQACDTALPTYSEKTCRLNTWKAMVEMYNKGLVKAIGVSNYNTTHLQEIIDASLPLPSLNQVSFSPHHGLNKKGCTPSTAEGGPGETCGDLMAFCKKHSIVFNGYSPFGGAGAARTLLTEPPIVAIAKAHNTSSAQVVLNWQWALGVPVNPEASSPQYQKENLDIFRFKLSAAEMDTLNKYPPL